MRFTLAKHAGSVLVGSTVLAVVAAIATPAWAVNGNLPGGTGISVTIADPADGATLPPGPATVTGNATIGTAKPIVSTSLTYVLDVSGSTVSGGGCGDDVNGDGIDNTVLDCEVAAAVALNGKTLVAPVAGTIDSVGVAAFGSSAAPGDVGPASGDQLVTGPGTDADNNGKRDVDEVLDSAYVAGGLHEFTDKSVGGTTNFAAGITAATTVATAPPDPSGRTLRRIVVFLSDGFNNGGSIDGPLAAVPDDVDFFTFAVGSGSACGDAGGDTLRHIADATGGTCTDVKDVSQLPSILPTVIGSQLTGLTLRVDGDTVANPFSTTPSLPQNGPASVAYRVDTDSLTSGAHTICVTAHGTDGGGAGSVTDCHDVVVNAPPVAHAGGPYAGQEGTAVDIAGSVTDPDGPDSTTSWSIAPQSGVDAGASCSIGDSGALRTSVTCTDDGVYRLTLTADDGVNPKVSASTTLTLTNVAPRVRISSPDDGDLVEVGSPVAVTAPFTDVATNDTHTCSVDFDDGDPAVTGTVDESHGSGTCEASHAIDDPGPHDVLVRVTDDDGDSATAVVRVVTYLPAGAFGVQATGLLLRVARTPDVTCPPDETKSEAVLNLPPLLTTGVLNASCTVDPDTGTTTAHASVDGATLLGGLIKLSVVESTSVAGPNGITRSSRVVGTINGRKIGTSEPVTIGIPGVAVVHLNESTTNDHGQLVQNAVRVEVLGLLGAASEQVILAGTYLG